MIRNFLQRLMFGRYGNDQLNVFLLIVYLILYLVGSIANWTVLIYIGIVLLIWAVFRLFSRNIDKRQKENAKFLSLVQPVTGWARMKNNARRDREHCYFKCPSCGQQLRAPRGKGKLRITCRSCGATFEKKT